MTSKLLKLPHCYKLETTAALNTARGKRKYLGAYHAPAVQLGPVISQILRCFPCDTGQFPSLDLEQIIWNHMGETHSPCNKHGVELVHL